MNLMKNKQEIDADLNGASLLWIDIESTKNAFYFQAVYFVS